MEGEFTEKAPVCKAFGWLIPTQNLAHIGGMIAVRKYRYYVIFLHKQAAPPLIHLAITKVHHDAGRSRQMDVGDFYRFVPAFTAQRKQQQLVDTGR